MSKKNIIKAKTAATSNNLPPGDFAFDPSNGMYPPGRFVISDYSARRPFTSFLPGIAGPLGIPLWVFYVNRGQAITSFGVESKDHPIMEFQSANKAYQFTSLTGFRTFLKLRSHLHSHNQVQHYEPFTTRPERRSLRRTIRQHMFIGMNELELQETNSQLGLQTNILYFTLPEEHFPALVRQVTFKNVTETECVRSGGPETRLSEPCTIDLKILDGMPVLIPYGVNNILLKELGRTIEAWMEVSNLDKGAPFFRMRASIGDTDKVEGVQRGNFAFAFATKDGNQTSSQVPSTLPVLVDPVVVFGQDTTFLAPTEFYQSSLESLLAHNQVTCGRTPCALFAHSTHLEPGSSVTIYSLFGHISSQETLNQTIPSLLSSAYLQEKHRRAAEIVQELTEPIATETALPIFDAYCRQTFLDNILRGGWPVLLGDPERPTVYHLYSRKHGDPERDYNAFYLAPEYYSQGNGSYRDINQNRRSDVLFNPQVADFNIRAFISLLQADGYNPLVVKGSKFIIPPEKRPELISALSAATSTIPSISPNLLPSIQPLLERSFTPGELLSALSPFSLSPQASVETLNLVVKYAEQHIEALFGEGYWVDHWVYNLDLLESYQAVYPDRMWELLFGQPTLPLYDSAFIVQPRRRKYVADANTHRLGQYGAVTEDAEKVALLASRSEFPNWMRTAQGKGAIYRTTLFTKLFCLALIKFATLDPWGMGIEMEAGRPGWDDALNGLPAMFGSSMPETYALQELLKFLRTQASFASPSPTHDAISVSLPIEVHDLLQTILSSLAAYNISTDSERDINYWDAIATARETYRQRIRLGFDGKTNQTSLDELIQALSLFEDKVARGIARAVDLNGGLPPTYVRWDMTSSNQSPMDGVIPQKPHLLPLFLEGMMRAMRAAPNHQAAQDLYVRVKGSPLYDAKLKMYKLNASLQDQPYEIGRAHAFPPGWLENESIWLHMEYKYLLEMLKAGLFDEFFSDLGTTLVPFFDPQIYGRSPLENSSFLVSSVHPDKSLHGGGFVGRLSGSTAEFLSIWYLMMAGRRPFFLRESKIPYLQELCLEFKPLLPAQFFTTDKTVTFKFLGQCVVTYHNPRRVDIYPHLVPAKTILHTTSGLIELPGALIPPPYAEQVRAGVVKEVEVFYQ
jgi:hypothetical protein